MRPAGPQGLAGPCIACMQPERTGSLPFLIIFLILTAAADLIAIFADDDPDLAAAIDQSTFLRFAPPDPTTRRPDIPPPA